MNETGVDLTLLNRLVKELNDMVEACEAMKRDTSHSSADYIVELSKAMGLATGVSYEASALVGDMVKLTKGVAAPITESSDLLGGLFSALGSKGKN